MNDANAVLEAPVRATTEFLIARVGESHVAIPADRVDCVLDARRGAEPPCDEPWVAGWFLHRDRMWLSVTLVGRDAPRGASAKRVLVRESVGARFAIEVDEVHGLALLDEVRPEPAGPSDWRAPKRWLTRGVAYDGRPVRCVNVDAVAADVSAA